jgi:hypothetical protein
MAKGRLKDERGDMAKWMERLKTQANRTGRPMQSAQSIYATSRFY